MEAIDVAETTTTGTFWDYNFTRFGSSDENYSNLTNEEPRNSWFSTSTVVIVAVIIVSGAVSALTVFGNLLVLVSFFLERNLRIPSNYFIASLAVTDLLIGMFSIPAFTVTLVLQYWPGGILLCDLWLSLDYTVCLVSQYTVLLITIDRFCSVKIPAKYRVWRTRRRVKLLIMITWICPAILFGTIHLGWDYIKGYRSLAAWDCQAQFITQAPIFNLALIFTYFWSTLVVLLALYVGIYHVAWQLAQKAESKQKRMAAMMQLAGSNMTRITVGVAAQRGGNVSVVDNGNNNNEIEVDEVTKSVAFNTLNKKPSNNSKNGDERHNKQRTQVSATKSNQLTLPSHFQMPSTVGAATSTTFGTSSTGNSTTVTGSSSLNTRSVAGGGGSERPHDPIAAETSSYDDFNEEFDDDDKDDSTATEKGGDPIGQSLNNNRNVPPPRLSFRRWFHWDVADTTRRNTVIHSISRWLRIGKASVTNDEPPLPRTERSAAGQNNKRRETKPNTENDSSGKPEVSTTTLVEESHHRVTPMKHRSGSTRSSNRTRPPPTALPIQSEESVVSAALPVVVEHQKLVKSSSTTLSYTTNDIAQPVTEYSTSSTATTEVLIQNFMVQQQNPLHRRQQHQSTADAADRRWPPQPLEEDFSTVQSSTASTNPFNSGQKKTDTIRTAIQLDTIIIAKELNEELRSMFAHRAATTGATLPHAPMFFNPNQSSAAVLHSKSNNALQAHLNEIWLPHSTSSYVKHHHHQNGSHHLSLSNGVVASFNGRTPLHPSNDLRFIDSESILSPGSSSSISSVLSYMNGGSSYRPFGSSYPNNIPLNRVDNKLGATRYYLKTNSSAVSSGYDLAVWQARPTSPDKHTDNSMSFSTTPNSVIPSSSFITTTTTNANQSVGVAQQLEKAATNSFFQSPSPATSPSDCDVSSTIMSVDESLLVAALPELLTTDEKFVAHSRSLPVDAATPKFPSVYSLDEAVPTPPASVALNTPLAATNREDSAQTIILLDQTRKISQPNRPSTTTTKATADVTTIRKPRFDDATADYVFAAQSYESNPPKFQLHPPPRTTTTGGGSKKSQLSRVSSQYSENLNPELDSGEQPNSSSLFYSSVNEEGIMFITDDAVSDYKSLHNRKRSVRSQRSPMNSFKQRVTGKQQEVPSSTRNSMNKKLRVKLQQASKKSTQKHRHRSQDASRGENRARKALRTITVIMGAYLLCWTPWHICATIIGLKGGDTSSVSTHLLNIATWLCYVNSPINPFCYAFANHQFKKTFLRILRGDFRRS